MNKVILAGRLTRDPEVRYTQSGKAVASFTVAVDRRFGRKNAENNSYICRMNKILSLKFLDFGDNSRFYLFPGY